MIDWNIPYTVLLGEYSGHTLHGQHVPRVTYDPKIEKWAAQRVKENPSPPGDFWDRRWAEYKKLDPKLTDAQRPPWLKNSVTPRDRAEGSGTSSAPFSSSGFSLSEM